MRRSLTTMVVLSGVWWAGWHLLLAPASDGFGIRDDASASASASGADLGKYAIETPLKTILRPTPSDAPTNSGVAFTNPRVEPGLIHWHVDFPMACAAAQKSGKPVLLFQMLGNLDDRFC